jgi:hypothetical protein
MLGRLAKSTLREFGCDLWQIELVTMGNGSVWL